ncbi:MAG: hypothetical protein E7371_05040 [Clostridiales bacterium]|nr:hypothetical protein [Clostridiales bacterium]
MGRCKRRYHDAFGTNARGWYEDCSSCRRGLQYRRYG